MKKSISLTLAIIIALTAFIFSGCSSTKSSSDTTTTVKTSELDRIKIYACANDEKGELLTTIKGSSNDAMGYFMRIIAETKSSSPKDKEDVTSSDKEYFVELLNYKSDGTSIDSNYMYIYCYKDKLYCYYPEEQQFSDSSYYICGYSNLQEDIIENLIDGDK
jgi:hypothetical protein